MEDDAQRDRMLAIGGCLLAVPAGLLALTLAQAVAAPPARSPGYGFLEIYYALAAPAVRGGSGYASLSAASTIAFYVAQAVAFAAAAFLLRAILPTHPRGLVALGLSASVLLLPALSWFADAGGVRTVQRGPNDTSGYYVVVFLFGAFLVALLAGLAGEYRPRRDLE